MTADPVVVSQGNEDVVVDLGVGTSAIDLCVDPRGSSEQHDGLVDQMAPDIEQQTARVRGICALAPRVSPHGRSPAIESGLEPDDRSQGILRQEPADREEVAVPSSVLEDREEQTALLGRRDEAAAFLGRWSHRLVDHRR